jgi:hypothetical protein
MVRQSGGFCTICGQVVCKEGIIGLVRGERQPTMAIGRSWREQG